MTVHGIDVNSLSIKTGIELFCSWLERHFDFPVLVNTL